MDVVQVGTTQTGFPVYQDDGDYVTFDPTAEDPGQTNVLSILTGRPVGPA